MSADMEQGGKTKGMEKDSKNIFSEGNWGVGGENENDLSSFWLFA